MRQSSTNGDGGPGQIDPIYVVYLLHVEFSNNACTHYVGSTLEREFRRRMRSHASGYGTTRTGAIYEAHGELHLVKTWRTGSRDKERLLLRHPEVSRFCSICSPPLPFPGTVVPPTFRLAGAPPARVASLSLA